MKFEQATNGTELWDARFAEEHKALREFNRRTLELAGPQGALITLKERNAAERRRFGDGCEGMTCFETCERWQTDDAMECDVWIAVLRMVTADADRLLDDGTRIFEEAVFLLPGFVLAAAIDENVLRGYIHLLVKAIWWDRITSHEERDAIATELIQMFHRRHSNPMPWDRDGWWSFIGCYGE